MAKSKNPLGMRLLGDRLIIEMVKPEEVTKSGLILTPSAQEETQKGVVIAVGSELSEDIKAGDCVLHTKYGLEEIEKDGKTYYLLNTEDVLAIVE